MVSVKGHESIIHERHLMLLLMCLLLLLLHQPLFLHQELVLPGSSELLLSLVGDQLGHHRRSTEHAIATAVVDGVATTAEQAAI